MFAVALLIAAKPTLGAQAGPVADHTYFVGVEKALKDGSPDVKAGDNHWSTVTEKYYIVNDSHVLQRDSEGKAHIGERKMTYTTGGEPFHQDVESKAYLGSAFRYIVAPTAKSTTYLTFPANDVNQGQELVEYLCEVTQDEVEVRTVAGKKITRSITKLSYSIQTAGLAEDETYDPITQKRSKK